MSTRDNKQRSSAAIYKLQLHRAQRQRRCLSRTFYTRDIAAKNIFVHSHVLYIAYDVCMNDSISLTHEE
jgi:hypothetical protein